MAVDAATTIKYDQVGVREDLTNRIYDVSPMDTPVMTAIGRGEKPRNTKYEWQTDALDSAAANYQLEGDDATYVTATATVRPCNYTQIFSKSVIVSRTAQDIDTAGRRNELLYQVEKRTKEIKRDIEYAITQNQASDVGARGSARRLGGLESWIETNDSRGSGGADGGYTTSTSQTVAATDASAGGLRTFTEARAKAVIKSIWDNSSEGVASLIVVGSYNKQQASQFSGIATPQQQYPMGPKASKSLALIGAADIYVSDFGKHRIVPDRFSRGRTALFLNPEYLSLHYLSPFKVNKLAKTGDADKRQIITELTMKVGNEKALGVCADLTTS